MGIDVVLQNVVGKHSSLREFFHLHLCALTSREQGVPCRLEAPHAKQSLGEREWKRRLVLWDVYRDPSYTCFTTRSSNSDIFFIITFETMGSSFELLSFIWRGQPLAGLSLHVWWTNEEPLAAS